MDGALPPGQPVGGGGVPGGGGGGAPTEMSSAINYNIYCHIFIWQLIGLSSILQSKLGKNSQTVVGVSNDEGFQSFKNCINHHLLAS